jgi:hypothetical protein
VIVDDTDEDDPASEKADDRRDNLPHPEAVDAEQAEEQL